MTLEANCTYTYPTFDIVYLKDWLLALLILFYDDTYQIKANLKWVPHIMQ